MAESVYKVVEVVGTSTESWEKAAKVAVEIKAYPNRSRTIKNGKYEATASD